jgi:hypothetical protein
MLLQRLAQQRGLVTTEGFDTANSKTDLPNHRGRPILTDQNRLIISELKGNHYQIVKEQLTIVSPLMTFRHSEDS